MDKINFEPIGIAMQAFDTDKIDIFRKISIENPDGTTSETSDLTPLYSNIPCHISFEQLDYPDDNTKQTRPVNKVVKINCTVTTDLQNGDLIKAYKLSNDGNTIETYTGVIGEPSTSMSRKTAEMRIKENI